MDELINQQIELLQTEMEQIANPYERAMMRVNFLSALSNLCEAAVAPPQRKGKESIKNDMAKPIVFEEEPQIEIAEPKETAKKEEKSTKKSSKKKAEPTEIQLEPTQVIVQAEAEDGSIVDLDVTEEYNLIADFEGSEEDKKELATQIASYALTPVFASLSNLKASNDKLMLAYYMQEFGVEEINGFVNELTDGNYSDVYEFATNDTVGALVAELEKAAEESEEE